MALYRCGGASNTSIKAELIGQFTSNSTSEVTRVLTDNMSNYRYLWFSMVPVTDVDVFINTGVASNSAYCFCPVEYFEQNALKMAYTANNTNHTITYTYVDDTTFTSKATYSASRTLYVYGSK